jgi:uncharacterized protein (DUF3084 family)
VQESLNKARKDAEEEKILLGINLEQAQKEVVDCENCLDRVKEQLQDTRAELKSEAKMRAALEYLKER